MDTAPRMTRSRAKAVGDGPATPAAAGMATRGSKSTAGKVVRGQEQGTTPAPVSKLAFSDKDNTPSAATEKDTAISIDQAKLSPLPEVQPTNAAMGTAPELSPLPVVEHNEPAVDAALSPVIEQISAEPMAEETAEEQPEEACAEDSLSFKRTEVLSALEAMEAAIATMESAPDAGAPASADAPEDAPEETASAPDAELPTPIVGAAPEAVDAAPVVDAAPAEPDFAAMDNVIEDAQLASVCAENAAFVAGLPITAGTPKACTPYVQFEADVVTIPTGTPGQQQSNTPGPADVTTTKKAFVFTPYPKSESKGLESEEEGTEGDAMDEGNGDIDMEVAAPVAVTNMTPQSAVSSAERSPLQPYNQKVVAATAQDKPKIKSSVVATAAFDSRSIRSLKKEIKLRMDQNAAKENVKGLQYEDNEDEDEAPYSEDTENLLASAMGDLGIAGYTQPLKGVPLPQGSHVRFDNEDEAALSPSPVKVTMRGLPEPSGTHVRFD